jgi:hypothetical protein
MAIKPRKKPKRAIEIDESIEKYFLTGEVERDTPAWGLHISRFFDNGARRRTTWLEHRAFLLRKWRSIGNEGQPWARKFD